MKTSFVYPAIIAFGIVSCDSSEPIVTPIVPEVSQYIECLATTSPTSLEVVTWNLEHFPLTDATMDEVTDIIISLDADVISLQEISSREVFDTLVAELDGWEGVIAVSGTLNLAFLYKSDEIEILEPLKQIYTDNFNAFPRSPVVLKVKHGINEIYLINIHLKCCGGASNVARRTEASELLQEYINNNLPQERTIVLGDFNDEIYSDDGSEKTFDNLINDVDNFRFADMEIAMSSSLNWSYPSWPSHIDHILISNEFFEDEISVETLTLNPCNALYESKVSDHQPVFMRVQ